MARLTWQVEGADQGQIVEVARCIAGGVEWTRTYDRSDRSVRYDRRPAWTRDAWTRIAESDLPPDLAGVIGEVS